MIDPQATATIDATAISGSAYETVGPMFFDNMLCTGCAPRSCMNREILLSRA